MGLTSEAVTHPHPNPVVSASLRRRRAARVVRMSVALSAVRDCGTYWRPTGHEAVLFRLATQGHDTVAPGGLGLV